MTISSALTSITNSLLTTFIYLRYRITLSFNQINLKTWPLGLYLYSQTRRILLLLMTILSQSFFPFVGSHLMSFSFLTAWHKFLLSYFLTLPFTSLTKLLDGLNEGIKCSGILIVTFLEILRAVFSAPSSQRNYRNLLNTRFTLNNGIFN